MTALKITEVNDHRLLIETFDYRTDGSFDEFCEWVCTALNIEEPVTVSDNELGPRLFNFDNLPFRLMFEDQFGCHIEGSNSQRSTLEKIVKTLMGN